MKGKGKNPGKKTMAERKRWRQVTSQRGARELATQCEGTVSSPTSTAVERASIILNSDLGPMNFQAKKDLGNESLVDLLETVSRNSRSLVSMVQETIKQPDDDEKEDKNEAKELKKLLQKIARRIVPFWNVDVLRGEHRGAGTKMFGLKITSKLFEDETRTYTLDYLEEKSEAVISDLRNIGPFRPSDYGFLLEYVRLLIDDQKITQVSSLSEQLNNCLPEPVARNRFNFMVTKVIEELSFFPKLSSNQIALSAALGDNSFEYCGVQLDTKEYVDRFDLDLATGDVVAFAVSTKFLTRIFEMRSHKVAPFLTLMRSWREYGLVSQPATYDDRHVERINIGGRGLDFYLFRIDDFNKRREVVKDNLRHKNHAK